MDKPIATHINAGVLLLSADLEEHHIPRLDLAGMNHITQRQHL